LQGILPGNERQMKLLDVAWMRRMASTSYGDNTKEAAQGYWADVNQAVQLKPHGKLGCLTQGVLVVCVLVFVVAVSVVVVSIVAAVVPCFLFAIGAT